MRFGSAVFGKRPLGASRAATVTTTNYAKTGGTISQGVAGGTKSFGPVLQTQRPNADTSVAGWTPTPSSPATLYDKIDDTVVSDSDYITATADVTITTSYTGLTTGSVVTFAVSQS